jgi:hypothetical protein
VLANLDRFAAPDTLFGYRDVTVKMTAAFKYEEHRAGWLGRETAKILKEREAAVDASTLKFYRESFPIENFLMILVVCLPSQMYLSRTISLDSRQSRHSAKPSLRFTSR